MTMLRSLCQAVSAVRTPLQTACLASQQTRGTCIVRRMYPPRLYKKGQSRALKKREYVYILDEHVSSKPASKLDVILVTDVEGVGMRGDQVSVTKRLARNQLFPAGLAIYASPENIEKMKLETKDEAVRPRQSVWAQKTIRQLKGMNLAVPMNPKVPWVLNTNHVKVAFRRSGVEIEEELIVLPEEPITEPTETTVTVTVNKLQKVPVRTIVHYWYADPREAPGGAIPQLPPTWTPTKIKISSIKPISIDTPTEQQ